MPNMDGTGPLGKGPFTGFGRGICANGTVGSWFGGGNGGFFCRRFFGDKEILTARKSLLEKSLDAINRQLENKE